MMHQFLLAGFGGQGVMLMGRILAYAGMKEQKQVMYIPSYGSEMRGGTANCSVILSEEEIDAPVVSKPSGLVVMNAPSFDKFETRICENGLVIVNSSTVTREPLRQDVNVIKVPANEMAKELGNERIANMILLGTLISATKCLKAESVLESLKEILPAHRHDLLPLNQKAIEAGMQLATSTPKRN